MDDVERAAEAIAKARGLLITAGAGMGVDSGLPDFRGDEGFWKAYPPSGRRVFGLGHLSARCQASDLRDEGVRGPVGR